MKDQFKHPKFPPSLKTFDIYQEKIKQAKFFLSLLRPIFSLLDIVAWGALFFIIDWRISSALFIIVGNIYYRPKLEKLIDEIYINKWEELSEIEKKKREAKSHE